MDPNWIANTGYGFRNSTIEAVHQFTNRW